MKAKEELSALKEEVEALNKKLAELTEEELAVVTGGVTLHNMPKINPDEKYVMQTFARPEGADNGKQYEFHLYK